MIKGFTAGAFDLLHAGHCLMLQEAKQHCDHLTVFLDEDPSRSAESYRGKKKNKPVQSLTERTIQLMGNRYVDAVVVYHSEADLYEKLLLGEFDVRIIGADWRGKEFTGCDLPYKVVFNSRGHNYSSTELRKRICAT